MIASPRPAAPESSESGIGLVEIVVSMFLLAVVAVALLPMLVNAMQATVRNSSIATANQLVSRHLDELRGAAPYCDAVEAFDDAVLALETSEEGIEYQAHRTVGTCPATVPGVVPVQIWVTSGTETLARADTQVYVKDLTGPTP